jgi:peptidoglycan hydrolase-like protein with peptidoglycan-binding domain
MGRRARLPELDDEAQSPLAEAVLAVGGALARNPLLVGGTTAFIVALSYVSANAIWYQPHFHSGAFFATRDVDYSGPRRADPDATTIRIEREGEQRRVPKPDPVVFKVQSILKTMGLYEGEVDGFSGPNTRKAISIYRKTLGMPASDQIDEPLLDALGAGETTAAIDRDETAAAMPDTSPLAGLPERPQMVSALSKPAADPTIMKVQAGLKAFGNDKIDVDGVMGNRTRAAIREFQSLFGLPVTGEPSEEVYAKMREIGLTN